MNYLLNVLIALDQLGNAIAGGNPDCTISGRCGYYSKRGFTHVRWYWKLMEGIINATFYPLDGHDHCERTYQNEKDEDHKRAIYGIFFFVLSLIIIGSCLILIVPFYILMILGVAKKGERLKK